jgi:DNA-directed RNA polymerase subunit RPC12/RpoP
VKQLLAYEVDLTKIRGNGDFSCPKCGITISPEDETEQVYSILETKVKNQILTELVIQCNRCASRIRLTGFPLLQRACE